MRDLLSLPKDLPVPNDDGACSHLQGMVVPAIQLRTTANRTIDLKVESQTPAVIFFYPRTGEPSKPAPPDWDLIPGARGCTPQSCGFRDIHSEFIKLGFKVFGGSSQTTEYQEEFVRRNHIPFEIVSDENFDLTNALKLPTFSYNGMKLIKRLAMILNDGRIQHVFYPIFPPDKNADTVLNWIKENFR